MQYQKLIRKVQQKRMIAINEYEYENTPQNKGRMGELLERKFESTSLIPCISNTPSFKQQQDHNIIRTYTENM